MGLFEEGNFPLYNYLQTMLQECPFDSLNANVTTVDKIDQISTLPSILQLSRLDFVDNSPLVLRRELGGPACFDVFLFGKGYFTDPPNSRATNICFFDHLSDRMTREKEGSDGFLEGGRDGMHGKDSHGRKLRLMKHSHKSSTMMFI